MGGKRTPRRVIAAIISTAVLVPLLTTATATPAAASNEIRVGGVGVQDISAVIRTVGGIYQLDVWLDEPTKELVCVDCAVGDEASLGQIAAGTELIFELEVKNTGQTYRSTDESRARITNWVDGTGVTVAFEDGDDSDFDEPVIDITSQSTCPSTPFDVVDGGKVRPVAGEPTTSDTYVSSGDERFQLLPNAATADMEPLGAGESDDTSEGYTIFEQVTIAHRGFESCALIEVRFAGQDEDVRYAVWSNQHGLAVAVVPNLTVGKGWAHFDPYNGQDYVVVRNKKGNSEVKDQAKFAWDAEPPWV